MPTPGTVEFPTALDGVVSLFEVNNRAYTTLSADINNSVLAIPLTDSTVFPATGVVTLTDSLTAPTKHEEIIFTANAANSLTVPVGGRGAFGSTAQNWSGTVYVRMRMIAEHHEVVRDAVIQLETKIGYGSATPTDGKFLVGNTTAGTSTWRVLAAGDIPDLSGTYQPLDADLTAIGGLSPSNDDIIQRKAGVWTNRTMAQLKADLSLNNVENTALSTWAGSVNITTLGTIATGTWNGSVIGSNYGGAGSISGILKANGSGVVSAASAGTDYLGVTAPGSSGNLLYNNANAYAAASLVNYSASAAVALTVTGNANGALFVRESTSGSTPFLIQDFPALFTLQNTDGSTFWQLAYTNDAAPNAYANFLQDAGHLTFSAVRSSDDAGLGDTHILPFGGIAIDNTAHTNTSFGMVYQSGNDIYALGRDNAFDLAETPANVDLTWGSRGITFRAPASAIADGDLAAAHLHFYQDEATNELKAKWKESGGSVNTITFSSGGASNPFDDATAIIKGSGDATKLLRIEVDDITTSTTRVWTAPDANLTVAGIDLAQTWTAAQSFSDTIALTSTTAANNKITQGAAINIGTTSTDGIILQNTTAAAAGAQQYSPRLRFTGRGWKTNATAASQTVDWIIEARPVQGAANPTVNLAILAQVNAGGFTPAVAPGQILAPGGGSSSQSAPQYSAVNNTNYGLRIGGGNAGNAVGVIAGSAYLVADANVNAIAIPTNSSLRWGAANFGSQQVALYSPANDVLQIRDRNASTVGGNLILGGSGSSLPTSATASLNLQIGTAPGSSPADQFSLYCADWNGAGTAAAHFRNEQGHIIKIARAATYTPTNVSTDRSYDANATTLDELADVVGTLIADLQTLGFLG